MNTILFLAASAVLLAIYLCGMLAQPKRTIFVHYRRDLARRFAHGSALFVLGLQFVLTMPGDLARRIRWGRSVLTVANEYQGAQHINTITKFLAVTQNTRHLIYACDTTDATGKKIVLPSAGTNRPLFVVADEVATLDTTAFGSLVPVSAQILGTINETVRVVAASAGLKPGDVVFALASGMVDKQANIAASAGQLWVVGIIVARTSVAAGDLLEMAGCLPSVSVTF